MTHSNATEVELAIAAAKAVEQCVLIGAQPKVADSLKHIPTYTVAEEKPSDPSLTFVLTSFSCEALAAALEKSQFDKLKSTLFVWLGGAGYRTLDAAVTTLAYVASLPKGSGVLLDYVAERTSLRSLADSALDALASRVCGSSENVKYLIQPQAVTAMLRSIGFHHIVDLTQEQGTHLVSAVV